MIHLLEAAISRFQSKVAICPVTGCWHWRGARSKGGQRGSHRNTPYGSFYVAPGLILRAHVYVAWLFGIIDGRRLPPGYNLDHTCENSLCVNPFHIELVTNLENQARRHRQVKRTRATWAERYTMRGIGLEPGVEAVEPLHLD